ncbi:hypothetical protein [Xanthobacter versatilis]|uniref:hypothetical protein n=1 Tax=Xanthobacter autotrophicus (strain ATCC BAA-1158 / Py2) TaxID=78245 RepID=UPI003727ABAE
MTTPGSGETISQQLQRLGYEHHPQEGHPFARRVKHAASGRDMGLMGVWEAAAFCKALDRGEDEPAALEAARKAR